MPKLGLGLSLPQTRVAGGFTPKKLSGLSLWLKADAGVTETPETFISQVVINGADNTPTSNGTYTRASGGETQFNGPNGNYIDWDGSNWYVNDSDVGQITYSNSTFDFSGTWADLFGTLPVPTSITSTTPTGNEIVSTWADQSGNNNNFSGGATFEGNYINGKPAIYFNGTNSYLDSPSTLLDNFSEISLFGVWFIPSGQSNKGVFGTSNYSNLEIVVAPDVIVRIRNGDYSQTFITTGFSNLDEWTISYLDAENESGVAYKNGQELIADPAAVQMPLASGVTYSLGRYAFPSFSGLNAEMYLAEFIIYNRRLTTQERQQVEQYLNSKYQIYPWRVTISGAGSTTSNGEYVWDGSRSIYGKPIYDKVGGTFEEDYISWSPADNGWLIFDIVVGITYQSSNLITWSVFEGESPAPSATLSYTP